LAYSFDRYGDFRKIRGTDPCNQRVGGSPREVEFDLEQTQRENYVRSNANFYKV